MTHVAITTLTKGWSIIMSDNLPMGYREPPSFEDVVRALEAQIIELQKEGKRLSGCLLAIHSASETVPASVLRRIAHDTAMRCIEPNTAEDLIKLRSIYPCDAKEIDALIAALASGLK
jgi:hypothetical protein